MLTFLVIAVAAAVALWPAKKPKGLTLAKITGTSEDGPSYLDAVLALQTVRKRLQNTDDGLEADSAEALNALTLALSEGSGD